MPDPWKGHPFGALLVKETMRRIGLIQRFSLISLIAFLALGAVFGWVVTNSLEQNMVARTKELSAKFISAEVEKEFRGKAFMLAGGESGREKMAETVRHLNLGPNVVRIKIWNKEQVVLWSDDERLIGQRFLDDKEVTSALAGKVVAKISPLRKTEQRFDRHFGKLLEVYAPVRLNREGGVDLVVETYQNLDPLFSDIKRQQKKVWLWTLLCFVSLYLILFGVVRDASKHIDAQTKVIETSYRMTREILEKAPFGIYVVSPDGSIEYGNPAMLAISGDTREEFLSIRNVFEYQPYVEIGLSDRLHSVLEGTPFFLGPTEYTSYYGRKTTVRNFVGIPLKSDGSRKALIFVEDVTERIKAEREQRKLEAQLLQAQKIELIGRLASGIAHDFNNLLSPILGYSEMALSELPEGHPVREMISVVKESGERATALIHQLLVFSRRQAMEMKPVNLRTIVENISRMLQKMIGEDIVLELNTKGPVKNILADQSQIEQVLMNLVVNARDAMPKGGSLIIEAADVEISEEFTSNHGEVKPGPYVMLSVSDTGVGMSEEVRERIFEPFFTTKEEGKGTGLGLATVYGIAKQHNGYVYVYSELGKGTTFKVYLPACKEDALEAAGQREAPRGGSETVLVVDDDPLILRLIVDTLQPLGYRAVAASDGEEALRIIALSGVSPEVLLTDVIMPKMDGSDLAGALRERYPGMKTIYMSGYTYDTAARHGVLGPGSAFIQKPITPTKLTQKLREVLDKPQ